LNKDNGNYNNGTMIINDVNYQIFSGQLYGNGAGLKGLMSDIMFPIHPKYQIPYYRPFQFISLCHNVHLSKFILDSRITETIQIGQNRSKDDVTKNRKISRNPYTGRFKKNNNFTKT